MRTREVAGLIRMHRYFMGAQRQPLASFPWYRTNFSRAGTNSGLEQAKQASALPCQSCWCHADLFCVTRAWNVSSRPPMTSMPLQLVGTSLSSCYLTFQNPAHSTQLALSFILKYLLLQALDSTMACFSLTSLVTLSGLLAEFPFSVWPLSACIVQGLISSLSIHSLLNPNQSLIQWSSDVNDTQI